MGWDTAVDYRPAQSLVRGGPCSPLSFIGRSVSISLGRVTPLPLVSPLASLRSLLLPRPYCLAQARLSSFYMDARHPECFRPLLPAVHIRTLWRNVYLIFHYR